MPEVGEKAQKAWAEFKESCDMLLKLEKELVEVEAEADYELIKKKLGQVKGLLKKREDALKRYLRYLKLGE